MKLTLAGAVEKLIAAILSFIFPFATIATTTPVEQSPQPSPLQKTTVTAQAEDETQGFFELVENEDAGYEADLQQDDREDEQQEDTTPAQQITVDNDAQNDAQVETEANANEEVAVNQENPQAEVEVGDVLASDTLEDEAQSQEVAIPEETAQQVAQNDNEATIQTPATEENEEVVAQEPVEETAEAEEFVPVQTWDISASDDDDVQMSFYATEDTESLLSQLAGNIKALFVPITAYASTEVTVYDGIMEIDDVDEAEDEPAEPEYPAGTVVVSGTGEMVESVYNYFCSVDKYFETTFKVLKEYYGVEVTAKYDETLTDLIDIDACIEFYATTSNGDIEAGDYLNITDEVRYMLNPSDMLIFEPTTIIIQDGVENVSDFAFIFCDSVKEIILPESVKSIGESAFAYCANLERVVFPEGLRYIDSTAFMYCKSLKEVDIPESVLEIGDEAFVYIAEDSVITCHTGFIETRLNNGQVTPERTTVVCELI